MTLGQQIIVIAICALGTMATRFIPFLVFNEKRPTPKFIKYLGNALPAAIFGMLIIYCFRNINFAAASHGIPEIIATAVVVGCHLWKRNMLISVAAGTVVYMLLVQLVF